MSKPEDNGNSTTQRMQTLAGLQPVYSPGEFVFLNSPMPGFPDGTRFKVVAARAIGANQYRYELQANGQTVWVLEADLRTSPPPSDNATPSRRDLSMTQRMQTMTLSQRMEALGLTDNPDAGATQRLRILDAGFNDPPQSDDPVTGEPTPKPDHKKPGEK